MCGSGISYHRLLGKRLDQPQGKRPRNKKGTTTKIFRCMNCGLIFSNPMPVPVDLAALYDVPPETYWKEEYFRFDPNYFSLETRRLRTLIPSFTGKKALDIGAGIGKCMIVLEKEGFEAHGIEPSRSFYDKAISAMGIPAKRLRNENLETVEYEEKFFDFITFGAVLEHLQDPSASILRAMKWLKPGGIIHIEVPSSRWFVHKLANLYYSIFSQGFVANLSPMHPPYHLYEFSFDSFRKHAKQNGYAITFHEYFVCETYAPRWLDPLLKRYMKWTHSGMQLSVWLCKR